MSRASSAADNSKAMSFIGGIINVRDIINPRIV
jgi:hypothetical protein